METNSEYKLSSIVKIMFGIILVILAFYGLTVWLESRETDEEKKPVEADIQYEEILMGSIYEVDDSEYYVLAIVGEDLPTVSASYSGYNASGEFNIYKVDLDNIFNKNYIADESNFDGEIPVVSETTLIKIVNSEIVEHITGLDEIKEALEK